MSTSLGGYGGMRGSQGAGKNIIPKGYKRGQLSQYTPEQHQLFQQQLAHLGPEGFLSKIASGDQGEFDAMEAPALRQFGALKAGIANTFSGAGSGSRRSSGFQQATDQAASNFAQQLHSNRLGLKQQALKELMEMSGMLLNQRPYEQFLTPKKKPVWQELLGALMPGIGAAGGGLGTMALAKKWGLTQLG